MKGEALVLRTNSIIKYEEFISKINTDNTFNNANICGVC
jgi:hypothetical protein